MSTRAERSSSILVGAQSVKLLDFGISVAIAFTVVSAMVFGFYKFDSYVDEVRLRLEECTTTCAPMVSREIDERCHCQTAEGWVRP